MSASLKNRSTISRGFSSRKVGIEFPCLSEEQFPPWSAAPPEAVGPLTAEPCERSKVCLELDQPRGYSLCIAVIVLAQGAASAGSVPNPAQKGPYAIGHVSFVLSDQSRSGAPDFQYRPIPVSVWYPVDPATIQPSTAEASYLWDPVYNSSQLPWSASVSSDWEPYGIDRAYQEPTPAIGPFPLVAFSPGWGAPIWAHISMATRLASHGFVVAVMYHYGDQWWWWEPPYDPLAVAAYNRPLDVSFVLSSLLAKNETAGDLLYQLIQPQQVAASGWSLGGGAAMTLAAGDDRVCDTFIPWEDYMKETPMWTCVASFPDPRIKAILPLDGSNQILHFYELARVKVPAIGVGEEWNAVLDWQARQHAAFESHPAYRVDVFNTIHQSFGDFCEAAHVMIDTNMGGDFLSTGQWMLDTFCTPDIIPSNIAHQLAYKYMIAFLKTNLVGVSGYQSMLTPGWALTHEQYVEFFVTEKRNPHSIDEDWPDLFIYFPHQPGSEQAKAEKDPKTLRPIPHSSGWRK